MAFFKNLTDSMGIGGTKVDTILHTQEVRPGGAVEGVIKIKGGKVERVIDRAFLNVEAMCEYESDDSKGKRYERVQRVEIPLNGKVMPKQEVTVPFSFQLHLGAPVTNRKYPTVVSTSLDIKKAIDPGDKDPIRIYPHPYVEVVTAAVEMLGLKIHEVENEYSSSKRRPYDFKIVQEIEFKPANGSMYRSTLDELEIVTQVQPNGVNVLLEIDRRARNLKTLFQEIAGKDESTTYLFISDDQLRQGPQMVAQILKQRIDSYL